MKIVATVVGPKPRARMEEEFIALCATVVDTVGRQIASKEHASLQLSGYPLDLRLLADLSWRRGFKFSPNNVLGNQLDDELHINFKWRFVHSEIDAAELLVVHGSAYEHGGHTGTRRSDDHRIFIDDKEAPHYENYIGISGIYASAVTATTPSRKRLESIGCEYLQFFDTMLVSHKDGEPVHEGGGYGDTCQPWYEIGSTLELPPVPDYVGLGIANKHPDAQWRESGRRGGCIRTHPFTSGAPLRYDRTQVELIDRPAIYRTHEWYSSPGCERDAELVVNQAMRQELIARGLETRYSPVLLGENFEDPYRPEDHIIMPDEMRKQLFGNG